MLVIKYILIFSLINNIAFSKDRFILKQSLKLNGKDHIQYFELDESSGSAAKNYNTVIKYCRSNKCKTVLNGQRQAGSITILPHAGSEIDLINLGEGIDLLRTDSSYAHGFTETTTALFYIDKSNMELINIFEKTTEIISPNGEELKVRLEFVDVNGDQYKDLLVKESKKISLIWNNNKKYFQ